MHLFSAGPQDPSQIDRFGIGFLLSRPCETTSYRAGGPDCAAGGSDHEIFTDSLRISRRDDNIWMADMLRNRLSSQATLLVGDAGYHMCQKAMELEAKRIESKFGVNVMEFVDTTRSGGPRIKSLQRTPR